MGRQKLLDGGLRRFSKRGKRFDYLDADGKRVTDTSTLARIQALGIPPAWSDVAIAVRAGERLQAVGRDGSGKWQYRYHDKIVAVRAAAKYEKLISFAERLGAVRWTTSRHLRLPGLPREKVCAAMVRLLNSACFRIGGDDAARMNRAYGISTLRPRHVHFSRELNRYIKEVFGPDFSAKDFRTWAGTVIAAWQLGRIGPADETRHIKRNILAAVDEVATNLGNTRAIARSSYIAPRIFHHYEEGKTIVASSTQRHLLEHFAARQRSLTSDERHTLRLLRRKPKTKKH